MSGKSQVKVYLPEELHDLLNADQRSNSEVVESALWREFGGERKAALDRRIEEKKNRVALIESEKNERERELQTERDELEALKAKREQATAQKEELKAEAQEALTVLDIQRRNEKAEFWADKLGVAVTDLPDEIDVEA